MKILPQQYPKGVQLSHPAQYLPLLPFTKESLVSHGKLVLPKEYPTSHHQESEGDQSALSICEEPQQR